MDISLVVNWILFLALFPMAFLWLRRAYRIFVKHNYEEVALKRGSAPENPEKWAPYTGLVNLLAGSVAVVTILGVVTALLPFKTWSMMAGMSLWGKIFLDYIISRQAHPFNINIKFGKKKPVEPAKK